MTNNLLEQAAKLDQQDPLGKFQEQFIKPPNVIYFDGNSLGMLLKKTRHHLHEVIDKQWGQRLIRSWNENWYELSTELGNQLAELLGARTGEIILSDSTSVNLFKLSTAILKEKEHSRILIDDLNFPTDIYLQEGIVDLLNNHTVELIQSDGYTISEEKIEKQLQKNDVGLMVLSHVVFKSGFRYDLKNITALAKKYNVPILWDLSHSAGVVPIHLKESGVEYAVGCTYKYLNGGPGCPAFLYINKKKQKHIQSPIWGWFGDAEPFQFRTRYQPARSIKQFLAGTPPILSLSALQPSLDLFKEVEMDKLWKKSKKLSEFFLQAVETKLTGHNFTIHSPRNPEKRGSHIILSHPHAEQICQALVSKKVGNYEIIPDFRAPNDAGQHGYIRFGFAPLYNSFEEVVRCISEIKQLVKEESYKEFSEHMKGVT